MPSRPYTLAPLFPEGMVTDADANLLKQSQAVLVQNGMWNANGHLQKRGGFVYATAANPLNGNTSKVTSCVHWTMPGFSEGSLVMGDMAGRISHIYPYSWGFGPRASSTASSALALPNVYAYPVLVYDDEVIVVHPVGSIPVSRWSGAYTAATSGSGTVSVAQDEVIIDGAGTNFTTRFAEAGQYIQITDDNGIKWYYRVEYVESDTRLRVSSPVEMTTDSGLSWSSSPYAHMNIWVLLDDKGRAFNSSTTVTGRATDWQSGDNVVLADDVIGQVTFGDRFNIAAVVGDQEVTVSTAPSAWSGYKPMEVNRRMYGTIACEHQNRLCFAGFTNARNRVAILPAGASASVAFNGIDSASTNPLAASRAETIDIPSPNEDGEIRALLSVREPGGLAVLRDRDFYMVYGEWPSVQVQKISSEVGCIGWRAACEIPGGIAWAGAEGVYIHRPGGGVENITDGKIRKEWTALARTAGQDRDTMDSYQTCVAYIDDHIVVSVSDSSVTTTTTYAYNMRNQAWAKWTGITPRSYSRIQNPGYAGIEAIAADTTTNRFLGMSSALTTTYVGSTSAVNGTFLARSGFNTTGIYNELSRVIDGKITYTMSGSSPVFVVKVGGAADTAVTVSTTGTTVTRRFRPSSTQMGVGERLAQIEITESSGTFTALELEALSFTVRKRRARA